MKILFPVLNGSYERMIYGLADELQQASKNTLQPQMLWMTQSFRRGEITRPEASLRALTKRYRVPRCFEDACYRSLRYKDINLFDVIRINMIDTPEVRVEKLLRWAIRYLYVCEQFLKEEKIDAVVFLLGRGLFQRCLGMMARHLGIPTFYLCDAFIPGETVHIWMNEEEVTSDLRWIPIPPLNTEENDALDLFIRKQTQVRNIAASPYDASDIPKKIRSFFTLLFRNDNLVGNKNAIQFAYYETLRIFRRFMAKKYYKPLDTEWYVFLPFQVYYDFHIPLYWAEYTNLEYFIDLCRKQLPDGYKLVVKEHPHLKGGTPINVLKCISRMKDVVLVDVDTNPQELLHGCSALITNCSSMGWQAMMHNKPVVVVTSRSHPDYQYYYADYGVTTNVDDEHILEGLRDGRVDETRVRSFLYHVIFDRYLGSDRLCPVEYMKMAEDDNMRVVAEYLYKKMKKEMKEIV